MTDRELDDRLAELLVGYGKLTPALVERAREVQRTRQVTFVRALLDLRLLTREQVGPLLEEVTGARALDPSLMTVYPDFVEKMVALFPPEALGGLMVFPAQAEVNAIHVCVLNPTDRELRAGLEALSGCRVVPVVSHEIALRGALAQHFGRYVSEGSERLPEAERRPLVERCYRARLDEPFERLRDPAIGLINRNRDALQRGGDAVLRLIREPEVVRLVHQMLCRILEAGASDVHVEPLGDRLRVRARVDGALRTMWTLPAAAALPVIARLKAMAEFPVAETATPLDGRISYDLLFGREVDFRFSLVPSATGDRVVLRVLDRARERRRLEDLGFQPDVLAAVQGSAALPNGILLVTGPTGSGKTTTLYAVLDALNEEDTCVLTAEDPVESRIDGTGQVQCDETRGLTFASALRSFLRQDPDVIMVGEIRDAETADIALKAALTGHLVLSTLHTNDAPGAIVRLMNMNLEPFVIASALRLVLAQRLLRRLCPECREPNERPSKMAARLGDAGVSTGVAYRAVGCDHCLHTGYRGRVAIHEALVVTDAIEELILERAPASAIRAAARAAGMRSLRDSALALVERGITSVEEAVENTVAEAAPVEAPAARLAGAAS